MFKNKLNLIKILAITICLTSSVTIFAQDIIILKNGDDIQAIVQEVETNEVKYKRFDNPNGTNYVLKKSDIFMIRYENGRKDVFAGSALPAEKQQQTADMSTQSELSYDNGVRQNRAKLTSEQVRTVMADNSKALQLYNNGRALYTAGQLLACPGAFLLGWDIGTRLSGGEGNGTLIIVGAAGMAFGLVMATLGENKIKTSVQLYNSKANNSLSYQINFGFTQTGVGLSLRF